VTAGEAAVASFLGKLLGRSPGLPTAVVEALGDLDHLAQEHASLATPSHVLAEVLPCLYADPPKENAPPLTEADAAVKLAGGVPLLRGETVTLDSTAFRKRWRGICAAVLRQQKSASCAALAKALRPGGLDAQEMAGELLAGRPEAIHARCEELGLDAALTETVLRWALFPVLARWRVLLAGLCRQTRWEHGHCQVCGSWPVLAEFRGLEQTRHFRCGLCAGTWEMPRLFCPFCGNRDHRQLGYFFIEGEEGKQRVATCDACRGYVKTVSTLSELSEPGLLVAELATLPLDLAAAERGFFVG
jgi:FdhE protein